MPQVGDQDGLAAKVDRLRGDMLAAKARIQLLERERELHSQTLGQALDTFAAQFQAVEGRSAQGGGHYQASPSYLT